MAKDHFCITTGCSVVGEVCEICGSHSGKEEYRCLLNVIQSSLIQMLHRNLLSPHDEWKQHIHLQCQYTFITRSVGSCPRRQSSTRNMLPPYLEDENSGPSELLAATLSIYLKARQF